MDVEDVGFVDVALGERGHGQCRARCLYKLIEVGNAPEVEMDDQDQVLEGGAVISPELLLDLEEQRVGELKGSDMVRDCLYEVGGELMVVVLECAEMVQKGEVELEGVIVVF